MSARLLLLLAVVVVAGAVIGWRVLDWYTRELIEDVRRAIGGE